MIELNKDEDIFKYRILLNGYIHVDELSPMCITSPQTLKCHPMDKVYVDEYYGRFFSADSLNRFAAPYGTEKVPIYNHGANINLPIVDVLRVPYRKIPVYKPSSLKQIVDAVEQMKVYSPDYKILFRGQNTIYTLLDKRPKVETENLYGSYYDVKEPSFLSSLARKELNYGKVVAAWHNTCALLLVELQKIYSNMNLNIRLEEKFHLLSLGIAQHYGLPSVGLDLTDNIKTALWFAIYKAEYSSTATVKAELIDPNCNTATFFVFRCPINTVFRYRDIIGDIGVHRPDVQSAYFNYCGWGLAKNQLAMNLMCAFRVDSTYDRYLPNNYVKTLFPSIEDDSVLRILLNIRDIYTGTALGKMLDNIYL